MDSKGTGKDAGAGTSTGSDPGTPANAETVEIALAAAWSGMTPTEQCLTLSRQIGEIIVELDEVMLLLRGKRTTLEEKMIAKYFHELAEHYARFIERIHHALCKALMPSAAADDSLLPDADARAELFQVNTRVKHTVDELLKIARYNFNFLEQYFEYDYFESLTQKHKFIEALDPLLKRFS